VYHWLRGFRFFCFEKTCVSIKLICFPGWVASAWQQRNCVTRCPWPEGFRWSLPVSGFVLWFWMCPRAWELLSFEAERVASTGSSAGLSQHGRTGWPSRRAGSLLLARSGCALAGGSAAPGSRLAAPRGVWHPGGLRQQPGRVQCLRPLTPSRSRGCVQPARDELLSQHRLAELLLRRGRWQPRHVLYKRCVSSGEFNVSEEMGLLEPHRLFLNYCEKNHLLDIEKAEPGLQGRTSL